MKYILGAGISGLLYSYYHPECTVITDRVGWGVRGANPFMLLYEAPSTLGLLVDLGLSHRGVVTKPYGAIVDRAVVDVNDLSQEEVDVIILKKMLTWDVFMQCTEQGVIMNLRTTGSLPPAVSYLNVETSEIIQKLVQATEERKFIVDRITAIDDDRIWTKGMNIPYSEIISTLPAPVFYKLWMGHGAQPRVRFNYTPVTFVLGQPSPMLADKRHCALYDARVSSPVARIGMWGVNPQYEITGYMNKEAIEIMALLPVSSDHVFPYPYGRIIQDRRVSPPTPRIKFLGRYAQWDHTVRTDHVLQTIYDEMGALQLPGWDRYGLPAGGSR